MTQEYKIMLRPAARKDIDRFDAGTYGKALEKISGLRNNPRPRNSQKLAGRENQYRLRFGDYRILYEVIENEKIIRVFRVAHRREAYR